jgi:thioredoxin reductase (NADPH)
MEIEPATISATSPGGRFDTDVAIVGAGPVGLFAVFECGMLGMSCHVFDALETVGGQCAALYPEKPIYDIPALPEVSGRHLVDRLVAQAAPFHPHYHLGQRVAALVEDAAGGWRLTTEAGTEVAARAVVIAAGVGAFTPRRPPLAGIERYEGGAEGAGVHYAIHDPAAYAGRRVVIAGGGDSAVDWALVLAGTAAAVHMVHRRDKFRAADAQTARLYELAETGVVELVVPYKLAGLEGEGGRLAAVTVADMAGNQRRLDADALLAFFGLAQSLGPVAEWAPELADGRVVVDPATAMTARPGLFAIGDVSTYPGKLKLILTGFAEAAQAAHAAHGVVFPGKRLKFEYSTTKGLPHE